MPGNEILVSSGVTRMFIGQPLVTSPSLYTTSLCIPISVGMKDPFPPLLLNWRRHSTFPDGPMTSAVTSLGSTSPERYSSLKGTGLLTFAVWESQDTVNLSPGFWRGLTHWK